MNIAGYRYRDPSNSGARRVSEWEFVNLAYGEVLLERKQRAIANNCLYPEDAYYLQLEVDPLYSLKEDEE